VLAGASGEVLRWDIKERERENLTSEPGEELSEEEKHRVFFGRNKM
jgi:hypothetical protein